MTGQAAINSSRTGNASQTACTPTASGSEHERWHRTAEQHAGAPALGEPNLSVRRAVNVGPILTPYRRLKSDPLAVGFVVLAGFCGGRGDAAEVSVFEAVAVSFE